MVRDPDHEQDPQPQDPDQDLDSHIREKQRKDIMYNAHYTII